MSEFQPILTEHIDKKDCQTLSFYNNVHDALAYKTNFSVEILTELKKLAEDSR